VSISVFMNLLHWKMYLLVTNLYPFKNALGYLFRVMDLLQVHIFW